MMGLEQYLMDFVFTFRYIGLFLLLTCGMIGVPVPDEFIMTFSGFQVSLGNMDFTITLFVAATGSFLGMNLSYWIGRRLGAPLLSKIGPLLHLTEKRIARAEKWFQRFGDFLIVIGYYIPGFRHLTAYFSGMSKLHYGRYVILAGIGSFIWALTFISLGRLLGEHWQKITYFSHHYLFRIGVVLVVAAIIIYLYSVRKYVFPREK